jgi:two-component system, chemotaxis family, protein-glutamate methylesterase/glutaminase
MVQLVVFAASAGGIEALATVLASLPPSFPVPIAVVQHVDPNHENLIPEILARRTALVVKHARASDNLLPGTVYVAPRAHHMLIEDGGFVRLTETEPVHFVRPSADRLFESAAVACGADVVAVVLSGTGSDGASGAMAVKAVGGIVIAQDEASSAFFGMPQAAIATGVVDFVLPLKAIAGKLIDLTGVARS